MRSIILDGSGNELHGKRALDSLTGSLAVWRAHAVFEAIEARGKVMFHFLDHYRRLLGSCRYAHLPCAAVLPASELQDKIEKLLPKKKESLVKVLVAGGYSKDHKEETEPPVTIISVLQAAKKHKNALSLSTKYSQREIPLAKMVGGYGYAGVYVKESQKKGYDSFVYRDLTYGITEGPYFNIFFVTGDGKLITPKNNLLFGVTRQIMFNVARDSNIFPNGVEEVESLFLNQMHTFKEAFITSTTTCGVAPVSKLDEFKFDISPKNLSQALQKRFLAYREKFYLERAEYDFLKGNLKT
jgi:branched-chain amino acid aminotransferase